MALRGVAFGPPVGPVATEEDSVTWEAWLTLAVVVISIVMLSREIVLPAVVLFGATVVLLVSGVLTPEQAFNGFSNPAPITVAALYVLAGADRADRRALIPVMNSLLGGDGGERVTLAKAAQPGRRVHRPSSTTRRSWRCWCQRCPAGRTAPAVRCRRC